MEFAGRILSGIPEQLKVRKFDLIESVSEAAAEAAASLTHGALLSG
jgi:hypothetical protein